LAEFIDGLLFAAEGKKLKYLTPRTVTLLPDQIIELVQQVLFEVNSESVIEVYFQFGQASIEERVLTALLEMIVADSISEELIKKNSKSVNVSSRMTRGVSGLLIKAVTVDKHPDQVQADVFDFVSRLQSVVVASFEEKKSKLIEAKSQGFRSLYDKSTFLWDEILQGNLEFEREVKEVEYAKALEVQTMLDWISRNKVNSKALVVKVVSQKWGEVSHRFTEEFTLDTENVRNRIPCYSWLRIMH
jgi:secreted Zn-dependent insulinase-like peptidase